MLIDKPTPCISFKSNPRYIHTYYYSNVIFTGLSLNFPDILLYLKDENKLILPYNERFMSFNKKTFYEENGMTFELNAVSSSSFYDDPVYFFVYNTENYYHFIYDTLPYLYQFFELRKTHPSIKLLVQRSSKTNDLLKFVKETFELLDLEYVFIDGNTNYKDVYFGSSLTHEDLSNEPPNKEIFTIYEKMISKANSMQIEIPELLHKKIYVSRRSYLHNCGDNIGTNYTNRRVCLEETELVDFLSTKDFVEVFPETWSMIAKIQIFSTAKGVVGFIGGGVCNLLFSPCSTESIVLLSPYFLDINYRFKYSLDHTSIRYYSNTSVHFIKHPFAKYMRVKIVAGQYKDVWAEIEDIELDKFNVILGNKTSVTIPTNGERTYVGIDDVQLADNGLNSPFHLDLDLFKEWI
jgi:hypothetical protein